MALFLFFLEQKAMGGQGWCLFPKSWDPTEWAAMVRNVPPAPRSFPGVGWGCGINTVIWLYDSSIMRFCCKCIMLSSVSFLNIYGLKLSTHKSQILENVSIGNQASNRASLEIED